MKLDEALSAAGGFVVFLSTSEIFSGDRIFIRPTQLTCTFSHPKTGITTDYRFAKQEKFLLSPEV